jgi:N-acetylneuraminic acid mutarotase
VSVYTFATQQWTQAPKLPKRRENPGLVEVEGKLYVIGGYKPKQEKLSKVVLRLNGDQWEKCDFKLPFGISHLQALRSAGPNIILLGGNSDSS